MIKLYNFDELKPEEILNRDIRAERTWRMWWTASLPMCDDALKDYALKFDGAKIRRRRQEEIDEASSVAWTPYFSKCCAQPLPTLRASHRKQVHKNFVERQARHRAGPEIYLPH